MTLNCKINRVSWEWVINFEEVVWEFNKTSDIANSDTILMRNGTGKTTSLKLIQRLFSGQDLSMENGGEDVWILKRCKYKGLRTSSAAEIDDSEMGEPRFSVTLDVNGDEYTLIYVFDNIYSEAKIHTQGPGEYYDYYKMPVEFTTAFEGNLEFSKLIFVDTQQAGLGMERFNKQVIDDLFLSLSNVKVLSTARKIRIPQIIEEEANKAKKTGSAKEMEEVTQQLKVVRVVKDKLEKKLDEANGELETAIGELALTEQRIENLRGQSELKRKYDEASAVRKSAKQRVTNTTKELLVAMGDPQNLPESLWSPVKDYYTLLADQRIPEAIAREYLGAVIEGGTCICGEEISSKMDKCIHEKMEKSMGAGVLSEVHVLKDLVRKATPQADIKELKNLLEAEIESLDAADTKVTGLDSQLDPDAKGSLEELGGQKVTLEGKIIGLKEDILMWTCTDDGTIKTNSKKWLGRSMKTGGAPAEARGAIKECKNLYWLEQIRKVLSTKKAKIAGIKALDDAGGVICAVFEHVEKLVLGSLQSKLKMETDRHLSKYNMQNELRIHSMDQGIKMVDGSNRFDQEGGSTGEELSIIMSLVEAISSTIELTVPMIIDNPTKGLGEDKLEGVENSLGSFNHQLILLIYDTERRLLPNYLTEGKTDPAVAFRENENLGERTPYVVKYGWDIFNSYTPKGSDRINEVG